MAGVACPQRGRSYEDRNIAAPPLPAPTAALPGSAEKVAVLEERARLRQSLWHPDDAGTERVVLRLPVDGFRVSLRE